MRIFITYCSAKKNDTLKNTGIEVTPDALYISRRRIQPFIETCKQKGVRWAIFSDLYGVWFPEEKHVWYEKSPDDVTETEFRMLLDSFDNRLNEFDEIFYYRPNPLRFHSLYKRLINETQLRGRVRLFSYIVEIR